MSENKLKRNSVFSHTFTFKEPLGTSPVFKLQARESLGGLRLFLNLDDFTPDDVTGQSVTITLPADDTIKCDYPKINIVLGATNGSQFEWQDANFTTSDDPFSPHMFQLDTVVGSFTQAQLDASVASSLNTAIDTRFADHGVYLKDYGLTGNGVTNDTVLFASALAFARNNKRPIIGQPGATYLVDSLNIDANSTPIFMDGRGSEIKASGSNLPANNSLVYVETPHGPHNSAFSFENFYIDCDLKIDHPLKIHGAQDCIFRDLRLTKGNDAGLVLEGESGFGIYGNDFSRIEIIYNEGRGVSNTSISSAYHNANNLFSLVECLYNKGEGWFIDFASGTYIACRSERNDGVGISIDNSYNVTWLGGYFENNHKNMASGADDSTPDELALLTANSSGVTILAPRDIGNINDSAAITAGNKNFIVTRNTGSLSVDSLGNLSAGSFRAGVGGGFAMGTAAMQADAISGPAQMSVFASGKNNMRWNNAASSDETYTEFRFDLTGGDFFRRIKPDTASGGKRFLYVDA